MPNPTRSSLRLVPPAAATQSTLVSRVIAPMSGHDAVLERLAMVVALSVRGELDELSHAHADALLRDGRLALSATVDDEDRAEASQLASLGLRLLSGGELPSGREIPLVAPMVRELAAAQADGFRLAECALHVLAARGGSQALALVRRLSREAGLPPLSLAAASVDTIEDPLGGELVMTLTLAGIACEIRRFPGGRIAVYADTQCVPRLSGVRGGSSQPGYADGTLDGAGFDLELDGQSQYVLLP